MSASERTLGWLLNESASEQGIARDALARALLEAARNADREQAAAAAAAAQDPRLDQLRRLLLGHEIATLSRLREQIDDPEQFADAVSRALPSAFAQATSRDGRLGQVLAPTVERATQSSIRSDPRTLVNIIYPVIVPAIRKSILETIDATLQAVNASLAYSLSLRGLRWRLEAWRTGVPFAEVVLRHTLVFRVEHVFLIHRHTGLMIAQATAEDATGQDPQLVSSMLVAIQDFVRDSFAGTDGGLDTLRHGELLLWTEQGTSALLVAVIRGTPPESLHQVLRNTLSRIHAERGQALEAFDGDSAPFADLSAQLAECVQQRQLTPAAHHRRVPWLLVLALLAALGFALDAWQRARHDDALWEDYVGRLRAEPGIVVADAGKFDGGWRLGGLRDPLAADPEQLLRLSGIDPRRVSARWQPYQALEPSLVLQRLQASLAPPPTVTLAADGDAIVASGAASAVWLARARTVARSLPPGSPRIDLASVRDLNDGELGTLRVAIEAQSLNFDVNEVMPSRAQEPTLDAVAQSIRQMADLSARLGVVPRVTVTGHSDSTGKGSINLSVSVARAEVVRALLLKRGVNPEMVTVRGAGPLEPLTEEASEAERSMNRRVSFRVTLDE